MMTKRASKPLTRQPANLSAQQIKAALPKLRRRLEELEEVRIERWDDSVQRALDGLQVKVETTLIEVFGPDTLEYKRFQVPKFWQSVSLNLRGTPPNEWIKGYSRAVGSAVQTLSTAIELLEEQLKDMGESPEGRAIQAAQGMDLHPAIGSAAVDRYKSGHFADAVESACKALNNLVQIKSSRFDLDGTNLMRAVFSVKNPVLCFVPFPYHDKSDESEQEGMMHLYEGTMLALRNPRAHKLMDDAPERAMEFIVFVSLLAKLLDDAKKL